MLSEDVGYAEYVNAAFTVENSRQSLRADALANPFIPVDKFLLDSPDLSIQQPETHDSYDTDNEQRLVAARCKSSDRTGYSHAPTLHLKRSRVVGPDTTVIRRELRLKKPQSAVLLVQRSSLQVPIAE